MNKLFNVLEISKNVKHILSTSMFPLGLDMIQIFYSWSQTNKGKIIKFINFIQTVIFHYMFSNALYNLPL